MFQILQMGKKTYFNAYICVCGKWGESVVAFFLSADYYLRDRWRTPQCCSMFLTVIFSDIPFKPPEQHGTLLPFITANSQRTIFYEAFWETYPDVLARNSASGRWTVVKLQKHTWGPSLTLKFVNGKVMFYIQLC